MTLEVGGESSQWWGPMGVAVIFGLAFATVLTLVVVPVMYDFVSELTARSREKTQVKEQRSKDNQNPENSAVSV